MPYPKTASHGLSKGSIILHSFILSLLAVAIFIVKMVPVIFSHYPKNAQPPTIQKYEWKPIEIYGH